MEETTTNHLIKHAPFFFLKCALVYALLLLLKAFAVEFPPQAIAIAWATLSFFAAIAMAYPAIIKKNNTKEMFQNTSEAAKRIGGRTFRLIGSIVLSAILIASLLVESQKWNMAEWMIAAASAVLYFIVSLGVARTVRKQYSPFYQRRGVMLWSWIAVGILLAVTLFALPMASPNEYASSLSSNQQLFKGSSSALLEEVGKAIYLSDSLTSFALAEVSALSNLLYHVINAIVCASAAFALIHLWSLCSLDASEMAKVFLPLQGMEEITGLKKKTIASSAAVLGISAALIAALFMYGEARMEEAQESGMYSPVEDLARRLTQVSTYKVGDRYYDVADVQKAVEGLSGEGFSCEDERNALVESIDQAYDTCASNVDGYLDWLAESQKESSGIPVIGPIIDFISDRFSDSSDQNESFSEEKRWEHLTDGVDLETIKSNIDSYNAAGADLESRIAEKLLNMGPGVEEWTVRSSTPIEEYHPAIEIGPSLILDIPDVDIADREQAKEAVLEAIENGRAEMLAQVSCRAGDTLPRNSSYSDPAGNRRCSA